MSGVASHPSKTATLASTTLSASLSQSGTAFQQTSRWPKVLELFTNRFTATMFDKQVVALQKALSEADMNGLAFRDMNSVAQILTLCCASIRDGVVAFIPEVEKTIRLLRKPLMLKSSFDRFDHYADLVQCFTAVAQFVSLESAPTLQHCAVDTIFDIAVSARQSTTNVLNASARKGVVDPLMETAITALNPGANPRKTISKSINLSATATGLAATAKMSATINRTSASPLAGTQMHMTQTGGQQRVLIQETVLLAALHESFVPEAFAECLALSLPAPLRVNVLQTLGDLARNPSVADRISMTGAVQHVVEFVTADFRSALVFWSIDLLSRIVDTVAPAAAIVGSYHSIHILCSLLRDLLRDGYRVHDKDLRNEVLALLHQLVNKYPTCVSHVRETGIIPILIAHATPLIVETPSALNPADAAMLVPKPFTQSSSPEDIELRHILWGFLFAIAFQTTDAEAQLMVLGSAYTYEMLSWIDPVRQHSYVPQSVHRAFRLSAVTSCTMLVPIASLLLVELGLGTQAIALFESLWNAADPEDKPLFSQTLILLRSVTTEHVFREQIVELGYLATLFHYGFEVVFPALSQRSSAGNRRDPLLAADRREMALVLSNMSRYFSYPSAQIFSTANSMLWRTFVASLIPRPETSVEENEIVLLLVDIAWSIFPHVADQFLAAEGIRKLCTLLEASPSYVQPVVLSFLSDAVKQPEDRAAESSILARYAFDGAIAWQSPLTQKSLVQVCLTMWRNLDKTAPMRTLMSDADQKEKRLLQIASANSQAEQRIRLKRQLNSSPATASDGGAVESQEAEVTTKDSTTYIAFLQESEGEFDRFAMAELKEIASESADVVDQESLKYDFSVRETENIRLKLFTLLKSLGFPEQGLSREDVLLMRIIVSYTMMRESEEWDTMVAELRYEDIRPTAEDRELVARVSSELALHLEHVDAEMMSQANMWKESDLTEESLFYRQMQRREEQGRRLSEMLKTEKKTSIVEAKRKQLEAAGYRPRTFDAYYDESSEDEDDRELANTLVHSQNLLTSTQQQETMIGADKRAAIEPQLLTKAQNENYLRLAVQSTDDELLQSMRRYEKKRENGLGMSYAGRSDGLPDIVVSDTDES